MASGASLKKKKSARTAHSAKSPRACVRASARSGVLESLEDKSRDREFFADGRYASLVVINIGRPGPNAWFPRLPRLSYDEVTTVV